jgi:hypothetical protein
MRLFVFYLFILFWAGQFISLITFAEDDLIPLNTDDDIYSKLSNDEKSIIAEYYQAYFPLKKYYSNLFISAQCKSYIMTISEGLPPTSDTPPILARIEELEFRTNSNDKNIFLRNDKTICFIQSDNNTIKKNNAENFISKYIGILTPENGYLIKKNNKNARYFSLLAVRDLDNVKIQSSIFENAVYAFMGTPLEHYVFKRFANPNLSQYFIESVTQTNENGNSLVEITICLYEKERSQKSVLKIKLFRNSWAVKEIFYRGFSQSGEEWHLKKNCQYNENNNDIKDPFPQLKYVKVERGIFEQEKQNVTQKEEYFITNFISGSVPLSEFDVKQFLPPGTNIETKKSAFYYFRIVCILSIIFFFSVIIFLKKRKNIKK